MGRQEKPLDPDTGPVARLAHDLRRLRQEAGGPTYAALARRAGYSVATLSRAAAGEQLPSLPVVRAYATACGADPTVWEGRWHAVSQELAVREHEDDTPSPYRGLARFEPGDQDVFFGRDRLSDDLHALAHEHRVVAVLGPSGSGKSSLLRAGLIPRLRRPSHPEGTGPRVAAVRILTPGAHPLDTHLPALVPADGEGDTWVIVDQFEEVFTLCTVPDQRAAFIAALLAAERADSRLRVVLGIRADFYGPCLEHPELAAVIRAAGLPVGPMSESELRQVITKPAAAHGLIVERGLTARLLDEVTAERTALPLLSHVLLETWRRRQGRTLTLDAYELAGGLRGSIAQNAESVYARLDEDRRDLARRMLLRLVTPGEGTPDTRRPTTRVEVDDLGPEAREVLAHLVRGRLVTLDHEGVDLTHEALITGWPRLARWIEEDRDHLRLHRRLTEAAELWNAVDRDPGALLRGTRLTAATQAFAPPERKSELIGVESAFLETSARARRRQIRITRATTGVLGVLVILSILGTAIALQENRAKNEQRAQNAARRTATVADSLRTTDPTLAARLSIAAWRLGPTQESRAALLATLGQSSEPDFTPLTRNTETSHASLSPDGTTLRVQQGEHVQEWNTATHARRAPYSLRGAATAYTGDDPRFVASAAGIPTWSPDGRRAAAASSGVGGIAVWDVPTGVRRVVPVPEADGTQQIALDRGGHRIAFALGGRSEVWDVPGKRRLLTLPGARDVTEAVALSEDGRLLARCGTGDRVEIRHLPDGRLRPLETPAVPEEVRRPPCRPGSLRFSPDGRTLAVLRDSGVERIDTVTGATLPELAQSGLSEVSFSRDSRFLAGLTNDALLLWRNTRDPDDVPDAFDGSQGVHVLRVAVPQDKPYDVRVDTTAGVIRYLGAAGRTVRTVNARSVLTAPWQDGNGDPARLSPDGDVVAMARIDGRRLWFELRTTKGGRLLGRTPAVGFDHARALRPVASFSPDGRFFAFTVYAEGSGARAVRVTPPNVQMWDVRARRPMPAVPSTPGREAPDSLGVLSGKGTPVVYGIVAGSVWDLTHSRRLTDFREGSAATRLTVHPTRPLIALNDGIVLRLPQAQQVRERTERDFGDAMAFSHDGDILAVADGSGRVRLYDGAMKSPRGVLSDGLSDGPDSSPTPVTALAFSPDGRTLAVGTRTGRIRLWDVPSRAPLGAPLPTGGDRVRELAFSRDGETLYTQGAHTRLAARALAPERLATDLCTRFGPLSPRQWATYIPDHPHRATC
ncbi:helix-turn-helix domain-containing protein [Streptomyces sp. NBC_00572]|uniref:nSTAND1 domain-containing NTPase n=1 Tax=Streptomyces sp. NBC_00572 TaxID=2903664 RepID=UPI0022578FA2|nr:helix-turn-helix domain-containing protein [Streptomyces sp. NBC_00572]MCX4986597.1 helix-turn-helix domain-containing protein [Streptomyces sp. NBC_00572]